MLDHPHEGEVGRRVDPEPRAGRPAPAVGAVGVGFAGRRGVGDHLEPEAEAPAQGARAHRLGQQVVRAHHLDRPRRQQPGAAELAAVQQHLHEPQVVSRRGVEPAAPGRPGRRQGAHFVVGELQPAVVRRLVNPGGAVDLSRRHEEPGVDHAEGLEDALEQELVERLPRQLLDQIALHVDGDAVVPFGARLRPQGQLRELVDHVLERRIRVEDALFPVRARDGVVVETVVEPARMGQQLAHGHRPRRRFVHGRAVGVLAGVDPQVGELGDEVGHGVVDLPLALFVEHHQGRRRHRLGHRVDEEDGIGGHRRPRLDVLHPDAVDEGDLAVPREHRHDARQLALVDHPLHPGVEPFEALRGQADGGRVGVAQVARGRVATEVMLLRRRGRRQPDREDQRDQRGRKRRTAACDGSWHGDDSWMELNLERPAWPRAMRPAVSPGARRTPDRTGRRRRVR